MLRDMMTTHPAPRRSTIGFFALAISLGLTACAGGSSSAGASQPSGTTHASPISATTFNIKQAKASRFRIVHGTWTQPPVQLGNFQPAGDGMVSYDATGGTRWDGNLAGDTKFTIKGVASTTTFANSGTIRETFTGKVDGIGEGTLSFVEAFTETETGALTLYATVVSGTGDLRGVQGVLRFTGQVADAGEGTGTYDGALIG
jgi:hypothetical protein